jgi:hypothetical protein
MSRKRVAYALFALLLCGALGLRVWMGSVASAEVPSCDATPGQSLVYVAGKQRDRFRVDSKLSAALGTLWERKMELNSVFQTTMNAASLSTRTLATDPADASTSFIVVLNPSRAKKRGATSLSKDPVRRPFSEEAFNFLRIKDAEILFRFADADLSTSAAESGAASTATDGFACVAREVSTKAAHFLAVNAMPFDMHSSLLVPFAAEKRAQVLVPDALLVALDFAAAHFQRAARSPLRAGFNSGGGGASVNHLHFQLWRPAGGALPVEQAVPAATRRLWRVDEADGVTLGVLPESYSVRGFVLSGLRRSAVARRRAAQLVARCAARLTAGGFPQPHSPPLPHNLLMTGEALYFFPRQEMQLFRSVKKWGFPEISGQITLFDRETFEGVTAEGLWAHARDKVSLGAAEITTIAAACFPE